MRTLKKISAKIVDLQISEQLGNSRIFVTTDATDIPTLDKEGNKKVGNSFGVNVEQFFDAQLTAKDSIILMIKRMRVGQTPAPEMLGLAFVDAEVKIEVIECKAGETFRGKTQDKDNIVTDIKEINVPKLDVLFVEELTKMKNERTLFVKKVAAVKNPFA